MTLTLVLGGARSGKSNYAQRQAENAVTRGRRIMIVTAEAHDAEMEARIAQHRQQRGAAWTTAEAPLDLAKALRDLQDSDVAVVDCLTLWMSNLLMGHENIEEHVSELVTALEGRRAPTWIISNEVGMGIVPENALARRFRDDVGRLHQHLAKVADHVVMIVAGLPLQVK